MDDAHARFAIMDEDSDQVARVADTHEEAKRIALWRAAGGHRSRVIDRASGNVVIRAAQKRTTAGA